MANKLEFSKMEVAAVETEVADERIKRWSRREPNPTVQMSIRMPAEAYDRFRALCLRERYTNGDMLILMMEEYIRNSGKAERK